MRKNYVFTILIVGVALAGILKWNSKQEQMAMKELNTSEYLIQKQLKEKIERRAAGYAKQDKPDKYLEYFHMLKTGGVPENNYPVNNSLNELGKAKQAIAGLKAGENLNWIQRGPGNVGGRTRGLVIDPSDATGDTWYTGPVGGGVWKTVDGGNNWTSLTMDWPNLAVSCLVMAESNTDVMYAGTGEGFGNLDAIKGNGVFKTTDRCVSWQQLSSTASSEDFSFVNRMVIDPADENIVVAVTNSGIFKTVDGGSTWTKKYEGTRKLQDIVVNPNNFNEQFATENNIGVLASVDGGENWKMIKEITNGRIELAIAKNFPEQLYALTSDSKLFLSKDGGDNWDETTPGTEVAFLSGQGWYNNTLVAHPTDENILFIGGVDQYKVNLSSEANETGTSVFDLQMTNTDFLSWKDMQGQYLAGGVKIISSNSSLFTDVELSFGSGVEQKAHRFKLVGEDLVYQDYVTVPLKVMDKTNNKQLMVSFIDEDDNGQFNLGSDTNEQLFINAVDYDDATASADISGDGGLDFNQTIGMNPVMAPGQVWDAANLPTASILFDNYTLKSTKISSVKQTVWYPSSATNYSHADHHNFAIVEGVGSPFRIVTCNDGGVFISDDGGNNWEERTSGYVTSQFYGISKHPEKNIYLAGAQDNGTWLSPEDPNKMSSWARTWGGDGFETAWSAADPNKMAMSIYNNEINITHDGGSSWNKADIGDLDDDAPFVTRIANEASNPDLMFVGGASGVWRSVDFGKTWSLVNMPTGTWNYGANNPHVAISPVNSKYVWAGNAVSSVNDLALSSDGGKTFSKVNRPAGVGAFISEIIAHPTDEKAVFVLFAQNGDPKIMYSDDLGDTWADLTQFGTGTSANGFPNVAVYSLAVMPYDTNIIWAGTEIGIFESTDGGQNWQYANNGLPAVCIWDMKIVGQQMVVATHGLGVWTLDIPEIVINKKPLVRTAAKTPTGTFTYQVEYFKDYERVEIYVDEQLNTTLNNVVTGVATYDINSSVIKSEFSSYIIGYNSDESEVSNYIWVKNPLYEDPVEKYMNPFSTRRYDFTGTGFEISKVLFGDWAIHTDHPYVEAKELIYTLKYPIIVDDEASQANLSYRDIALVEPGDPGTEFGDEKYWDYVIVEATKDGINWVALADGYDVNYSSKWSSFVNQNSIDATPDSENMFEEHTINLHDSFDAGDIILIRFRMHSDAATVGWGWVIDDIIIQESGTSVGAEKESDMRLSINPNPVVDYIDVEINSKDRGDVVVAIYDLSGRVHVVRDYRKETNVWSTRLQLQELGKGMKVVTVTIDGKIHKKKILVK